MDLFQHNKLYQLRGALTSILITSHLLLVYQILHTAAPTTPYPDCGGQSYTENSPFYANLITLLDLLTSISSTSNSYYSTSLTSGNTTSDVAYGLYMCQADLASSDCHTCIKGAATTIIDIQGCSGYRQAIIWYDNCHLRYSDSNFFGNPNTNGFNMTNPYQETNLSAPFNAVAELVKYAPEQPLMFASAAMVDESIYSLAQCTVDLTPYNCSKCLTTILGYIKTCCTQRNGWRYLSNSCWVRYEPTPFLKILYGTPKEIIQRNCSSSNFAPQSVGMMKPNLDNLLSNLMSKAPQTGYYNTTIGYNSNKLYGLALCRGDLTPPNNDCKTCLNNAQANITTNCGNNTKGIIWYEKCLMRYSDQNFFGLVDYAGQYLCGTKNISQAASDTPVQLARGIFGRAANNQQMVAAVDETVGSLLSSYVLVQCTRDLSSKDCNSCLEKGLNVISLCNKTNGWRYMSGSCTLRYEVFPFYNTSVVSSPVPPPLQLTPPPPLDLPPENGAAATDVYEDPIKAYCSGQSYAENSPFSTNLHALLSSLTSKASTAKSTSYLTAGNTSDAAYGLYMCQADLASSDCHTCIETAVTTIINTQSCSGYRQAIIWYDYCQLRYSDSNIFGNPNTNGFSMNSPDEETESSAPFNAVAELLKYAPQQPLMFASTVVAEKSIYALAQCTVDLTAYNCSKCLTTILNNIKGCCTQQKGWRYLSNSCWVRYESTPFLKNLNGTSKEIIRSNCSSSKFVPKSIGIVKADLDNLLSNLVSKARQTGYYNTTIGNNSNELYGLALCRGDLIPPSNDCDMCLNNAWGNITTNCGNSTKGIIWHEKCLMRYSDQNFFGGVDFAGQFLCGMEKINQAASDATIKLARGIFSMAANNPQMFATVEGKLSSSLSSYVLVQCTRDLSSKDCNSCLEKGLSVISLCNQTNGWRYMSGSCTLRYEVFPFYKTSAVSSPAPPPLDNRATEEKKKSSNSKIAVILAPILGTVLLGSLLYYLWWRPRRKNERGKAMLSDANTLPNRDLPLMDLATIQAATNNFSNENKLGEGGFGPVYKGMLHGGMEIAVKRLSAKSKQGATEFKNEVKLIAKLQHKNLVRMLGCCVEGEEKLLIYEFLPHKSLDTFLFDPDKRANLDWNRRFNIIVGIAKGLLYLHEDSLLKVVHRDLKASNVLLDNEMNPKIADFGLSKIFGSDESEANTNRIVGTYGYMAPEYAMDGLFSVKSDVYSFGVLLLEIVSGEKNGRSHYEKSGQTLLRHAWRLWNENKSKELMDSSLGSSYPTNEAMKCIHIGLLCVQENAKERPTMSLVINMLRGEDTVVSQPTAPSTFIRRKPSTSETSSTTQSIGAHSINELTESILEPR